MSPVRTQHLPRFGSQLSSSERTEHGSDRLVYSIHSESEKRGKKRNKNRAEKVKMPLLKVKLPKFKIRALTVEPSRDQTLTEMISKPSTSKTKSSNNKGSQHDCVNSASALVDGDVFLFTQKSNTQPKTEKEKAKLSVLRTISKMLEENQLIRSRLFALSQSF